MTDVQPGTPAPMTVQWITDPNELPIPVNQLFLQGGLNLAIGGGPDQIYVSFGHASPPSVPLGTPRNEVPQLLSGQVIPISRVAYMVLTEGRLQEMADVLNGFLKDLHSDNGVQVQVMTQAPGTRK